MIQYMGMLPTVIHNSIGEVRKVIDFRKRINYDLGVLLVTRLREDEYFRVDILANRLYRDLYKIGPIIDANDTDLFSKNVTDEIRYVFPELV